MIKHNLLNKDYLYMSIDFGIKKIGFAIGQLITKKATPLGIIYNHKENINWADIDHLIKKWKPNIIIIGYPSADKKNKFIENLDSFITEFSSKYDGLLKVDIFSEVLSTEESKEIYKEMRKSQYKISKKDDLDDYSASIILQSWFNENMIN